MPRKHKFYNKKLTVQDGFRSRSVSKKRISRKYGIFSKGCFSGSLLRDTAHIEEAQARAEEDLARILSLAKGSRTDETDPYEFAVRDTPDIPKKFEGKYKRAKEHHQKLPFHKNKKPKLSPIVKNPSIKEAGFASPSSLHAKEPSPINITKDSPKCVSYEEFFEHIISSLFSSTETKTESLFGQILKEVNQPPSQRLTCSLPTSDKLLSKFLQDKENMPLATYKGQSHKISSPYSPEYLNEKSTLGSCSLYNLALPTSEFKRQASFRKCKQNCRESNKAYRSSDKHNSSITLFLKNYEEKLLTKQHQTKDKISKNNSKYADASAFLKRYEKLSSSLNIGRSHSPINSAKRIIVPTSHFSDNFFSSDPHICQKADQMETSSSNLTHLPQNEFVNPLLVGNFYHSLPYPCKSPVIPIVTNDPRLFHSGEEVLPYIAGQPHVPFSQLPKQPSPNVFASSLSSFPTFSPFAHGQHSRKIINRPHPKIFAYEKTRESPFLYEPCWK